MSNFAGETVHADNQNSGSQEQAVIVETYPDGSVKVQFSDGTTQILQQNQMQTG